MVLLGCFDGEFLVGKPCSTDRDCGPHLSCTNGFCGGIAPNETDATASDGTAAAPSCGNGIVEPEEECDDEGESTTCDGDCTAVVCGDATINATAGEQCDGTELGSSSCNDLGFFTGTLACTDACTYDTSGCYGQPGAPELSFAPIKQLDLGWAAVEGAEHYQVLESRAPEEPYIQAGGDVFSESASLTVPLFLRSQASYAIRACSSLVEGCSDSPAVGVEGSLAEGVGYFKASDADANDAFGASVALSHDGSTLVVGARAGDGASGSPFAAGAVYVFVRDEDGQWSQQAMLLASNVGANDHFGASVALSADGNTLAVGAPDEDKPIPGVVGGEPNGGLTDAGAVYVLTRDEQGEWLHTTYVEASNPDADDHFGSSVALSADGNTLAVGAPDEDDSDDSGENNNEAPNAGAVYLFRRSGPSSWQQQFYIKASAPGVDDEFGTSIALSGDGNTLAIGAIGEASDATGIDGSINELAPGAGAVYVFEFNGMSQWTQQAYVKASNTGPNDSFGSSVALSNDANTLAVGATGEASLDGSETDDSGIGSGAVYVFARGRDGSWTQQAYVKASNIDPSDSFGSSVALSGDGSILTVGAEAEGSSATGIGGDQADDSASNAGSAYAFLRAPEGEWEQQAYVKAPNADSDDSFGRSMALSGDGNTLAIGASEEDSNATGIGGDQASDAASAAGAVYLY
jgi:hypothetical protein